MPKEPSLREWRLAPDLLLERFDDQALILLAWQDRLLAVNRSAADVMELMQKEYGSAGFSRSGLASTLERHFSLRISAAEREAAKLIEDWWAHGMLVAAEG